MHKVLSGSAVSWGKGAQGIAGERGLPGAKGDMGARGHAAQPVLPVLRVSVACQVPKANGETLACPASVVLEAKMAMTGLVYI